MASNERVRKVAEQIRRELVQIFKEVVKHEKISFVSITGIDLSRDFKFATVYITVIGDDLALRDSLLQALNDGQKSIRHLLAKRLSTRTVPEMTFVYDESVEYGARMEKLIDEVVSHDEKDKD